MNRVWSHDHTEHLNSDSGLHHSFPKWCRCGVPNANAKACSSLTRSQSPNQTTADTDLACRSRTWRCRRGILWPCPACAWRGRGWWQTPPSPAPTSAAPAVHTAAGTLSSGTATTQVTAKLLEEDMNDTSTDVPPHTAADILLSGTATKQVTA